MNLLLIEAGEVGDAGKVVLADRRAEHLRRVLRVAPGRRLRAGIVDGALAEAEVTAVDGTRVVLRLEADDVPPPRPEDTLILAVPRPIVLRRILAQAAALGFGEIVLLRTRWVDRSYLGSSVLEPGALRAALVAGLEQARRTHVPRVSVRPRFKPFVEDVLDGSVPDGNRRVAHPDLGQPAGAAALEPGALTLALGPERGFTEYEVERLMERGFVPVTVGDHPLRTEWALPALWAKLRE